MSAHGFSNLHRLAGRAFEAADAAKAPALDNRTAIGRAMTAVLTVAHDALREAKELAAQAHPAEEPAGSPSGGSPPDADFEPDPCSQQVRGWVYGRRVSTERCREGILEWPCIQLQFIVEGACSEQLRGSRA